MVQKSQGQPPFGCIKNGKEWDKLPTSTGYIAGFLNHQEYQLVHSISFSHHPSKGFIQPISLAGMFRKTQTFTSESPLGPTQKMVFQVVQMMEFSPVVWSPMGSPYFQGDLGFLRVPRLESQTTWVPNLPLVEECFFCTKNNHEARRVTCAAPNHPNFCSRYSILPRKKLAKAILEAWIKGLNGLFSIRLKLSQWPSKKKTG